MFHCDLSAPTFRSSPRYWFAEQGTGTDEGGSLFVAEVLQALGGLFGEGGEAWVAAPTQVAQESN